MESMMDIILEEVKKNQIKIKKWSRSSCGEAYEGREIKIPKPEDFDTLGVCFHEIGHIVLNHFEDDIRKPRYVEEFEAEIFAIEKLKEYGFYNKRYELRAKAHVLMKLAQAKNRGHNMKKVPKEIVSWTGLQINKWNQAKRVFVDYSEDYKNMTDVLKSVRLYKRKWMT